MNDATDDRGAERVDDAARAAQSKRTATDQSRAAKLEKDTATLPGGVTGTHREEDPVAENLRQAEEELRVRLVDNPNDRQAFATLARLVAVGTRYEEVPDPLTADELPADQRERINTAVWALADEYVGNSRAWYPLIQLARLSLTDDRESALRRLRTACEREDSGAALVESVQMLRRAGLPDEALQLGIGYWDPADHVAEAGKQLVWAACEANRWTEAQQFYENLVAASDPDEDFTELQVAIQAAMGTQS